MKQVDLKNSPSPSYDLKPNDQAEDEKAMFGKFLVQEPALLENYNVMNLTLLLLKTQHYHVNNVIVSIVFQRFLHRNLHCHISNMIARVVIQRFCTGTNITMSTI